jgi:hypothetical protein
MTNTHFLHYEVEGARMSGDMNTSSGNCMIMVSLVFAYLSEKRIKWRLANNGDDCVIVIEQKHLGKLEDLPKWFLKMGFRMEVEEPVYEFERIEFCQT